MRSGSEAAAETYFSRHAAELDLPQAALIAGLPRAPSSFDPLLNPGGALERRNDVLAAMLSSGAITPSAFSWASHSSSGLRPGGVYSEMKEPPFFGFVRDELVAKLGEARVEEGGLRREDDARLTARAGREDSDQERAALEDRSGSCARCDRSG